MGDWYDSSHESMTHDVETSVPINVMRQTTCVMIGVHRSKIDRIRSDRPKTVGPVDQNFQNSLTEDRTKKFRSGPNFEPAWTGFFFNFCITILNSIFDISPRPQLVNEEEKGKKRRYLQVSNSPPSLIEPVPWWWWRQYPAIRIGGGGNFPQLLEGELFGLIFCVYCEKNYVQYLNNYLFYEPRIQFVFALDV